MYAIRSYYGLDLYEEKQTRKEAREASEKLELRSDLVENDLSQLTDLLEEYRITSYNVCYTKLLRLNFPMAINT